MLGQLFCSAKAAAISSAEVVVDAAEKAHTAAKSAANEFTLAQLKTALEGAREQEWEAPDVWVTILNVDLKEGLEAQDINVFSLKGLAVRARVEIIGTIAQLTGMLAADSAKKVMDKVSIGEKTVAKFVGLQSLGIGELAAQGAAATKSSLAGKAAEGSETKSAEFDLKVDLVKTVGVASVNAKVQILDSSSTAIKKYLSNALIQKYVEDALSRRVTHELTELHQQYITIAKAREKIHGKAMEFGTMATDYTNSSVVKAKAAELGAMATEYTSAGMVKAGIM